MDQVNHLLFLYNIGPLHAELLSLVSCINIVKDWEFRSNKPGEMSSFNIAKVKGEEEFMMPYHVSNPFVVRPSTKSRDWSDWTNIGEQKDEPSSATRKWFVMRANLFWTYSLEQSLHVVVMGVNKWVWFSVIGMNITSLHVGNTFLIVALTVCFFVFWLNSERRSVIDVEVITILTVSFELCWEQRCGRRMRPQNDLLWKHLH